jgi:hypothetical protein
MIGYGVKLKLKVLRDHGAYDFGLQRIQFFQIARDNLQDPWQLLNLKSHSKIQKHSENTSTLTLRG